MEVIEINTLSPALAEIISTKAKVSRGESKGPQLNSKEKQILEFFKTEAKQDQAYCVRDITTKLSCDKSQHKYLMRRLREGGVLASRLSEMGYKLVKESNTWFVVHP